MVLKSLDTTPQNINARHEKPNLSVITNSCLLSNCCLLFALGRPQYGWVTTVSNVGVPQGTVLSLFLLTLHKSDFIYNSECCHEQKVTDTTAVVGCIRSGQDEEYRKLIADFVEWCESRQFHLNSSKTKELMVDFRVSGWGLGAEA